MKKLGALLMIVPVGIYGVAFTVDRIRTKVEDKNRKKKMVYYWELSKLQSQIDSLDVRVNSLMREGED